MKQPQNLITWLRYHREQCGVKRFYLRLEDSPQLVPLLRRAPWKDCVRYTFIELIKNPRYNFWGHSFTRCAPDIERLFESVARSCIAPPPKAEGQEGPIAA